MKIEVESHENGWWTVKSGDKSSGELGYDECIGLLATMIALESGGKCMGWMKTKEQHDAWYAAITKPQFPVVPESEKLLTEGSAI